MRVYAIEKRPTQTVQEQRKAIFLSGEKRNGGSSEPALIPLNEIDLQLRTRHADQKRH